MKTVNAEQQINEFVNLLNKIGESFSHNVRNANARAEELQRQIDRHSNVYAKSVVTAANDAEPIAKPVKVSKAGKGGRYPDAMFLDVLTTHFQTARQLHVKLLHSGVSKGSIYARYQRLADDPTTNVEADDFSYRLKAPVTAPDRKSKVAAQAKRSEKPRVVRKAANDTKAIPKPKAANDPARPVLVNGDGLAMLRKLPNGSVDALLTDLPYGLTGHGFDPVIDVQEWMDEMLRVVSDRGAIVAFASGSFTSALTQAGGDFLKDRLVWHKPKATGQQLLRHMQAHEDILIFSKGTIVRHSKRQMTFNPQNTVPKLATGRKHPMSHLNSKPREGWAGSTYMSASNYPRTVLEFGKDAGNIHRFQKPVALLEYLIRTYSNPGELVVDPTMGSGSAAIAAINCQRAFMGAENGIDDKGRVIFDLAKVRIDAALVD
ncbi:DNA modification methylase [Sphingomonas faeni]|uniref:site-specific DNA-methyltransferase (adenine-specific) n=1 Tax=Sphingomonas faeni TaxID=185950 RepID=A0A2T5U242_9SPHN|nr:site-specific DNA-methyltransferase [Sphingomonas faeni]PTW45578.1 DNA modification methylase [Sphingomonas faeni]